MTWIIAILLGTVFGYAGYITIPFYLKIEYILKKESKRLASIIAGFIWLIWLSILVWGPQFILIKVFSSGISVERMVTLAIEVLFFVVAWRTILNYRKDINWELFESNEHDLDFSAVQQWNPDVSCVQIQVRISDAVNIKCKIPEQVLRARFTDSIDLDPCTIFEDNKYVLFHTLQKRIHEGLYDGPRTIVLKEDDFD